VQPQSAPLKGRLSRYAGAGAEVLTLRRTWTRWPKTRGSGSGVAPEDMALPLSVQLDTDRVWGRALLVDSRPPPKKSPEVQAAVVGFG
jgi:hypothetical protein